MQSVLRRVFTHEYRTEAVKRAIADGLEVADVARKSGLLVNTYSRWIREASAGVFARVDTYIVRPVSDLQARSESIETRDGRRE